MSFYDAKVPESVKILQTLGADGRGVKAVGDKLSLGLS